MTFSSVEKIAYSLFRRDEKAELKFPACSHFAQRHNKKLKLKKKFYKLLEFSELTFIGTNLVLFFFKISTK